MCIRGLREHLDHVDHLDHLDRLDPRPPAYPASPPPADLLAAIGPSGAAVVQEPA